MSRTNYQLYYSGRDIKIFFYLTTTKNNYTVRFWNFKFYNLQSSAKNFKLLYRYNNIFLCTSCIEFLKNLNLHSYAEIQRQ
jgi:alpha-amylase/alpha-mannosidase (GH57 family)